MDKQRMVDFKKAESDYRTLIAILGGQEEYLSPFLAKAVSLGLITDSEKSNIELCSVFNL